MFDCLSRRAGTAAALALLVTIYTTGPAAANDSSAGLKAGGLVLLQNDAIVMESEDLYISPSAVRVNYLFRNKTDRDQTIYVAFPLPDLDLPSFEYGDSGIQDYDKENFANFTTSVEGSPVTALVQHRAFYRGVDITNLLEGVGIPMLPPGKKLKDKLKSLSAGERAELDRYGAVSWTEPENPVANWTLKTTYYWQQTFPAGKTLAVEHRYRPMPGAFIMTADHFSPRKRGIYGEEDAAAYATATAEWPYDKYCMDEGFRRTAIKRGTNKDGVVGATGTDLEYILTTGGNWAGPIKTFRLVVDKEKPENLVSFCAEGVRKISPTQFEWVQTDFNPTRDLKILIVQFYPG